MASHLFVAMAYAQDAGGGGEGGDLPWVKPLEQITDSLTGPIAKGIGVVALAASGGMLAVGGELSDFTKRIMMVVLAVAVMVLAGNFMDTLGFN
jgi:type IV secretion system protein TrbC